MNSVQIEHSTCCKLHFILCILISMNVFLSIIFSEFNFSPMLKIPVQYTPTVQSFMLTHQIFEILEEYLEILVTHLLSQLMCPKLNKGLVSSITGKKKTFGISLEKMDTCTSV